MINVYLDFDKENQFIPTIKHKNLRIFRPDKPGDFNDFQDVESEIQKIKNCFPTWEVPKVDKKPYIPSPCPETDLKRRLEHLNIQVRFNTRDIIEEFKKGDEKWTRITDGQNEILLSDCNNHDKVETKNEKLKIISPTTWSTYLKALANRKKEDPFINWLKALPKWDNKPRIKTMLSDVFKVNGSEELAQWAFKTVLYACIHRSFTPGIKFDHMVILYGPQDIGKSSLWSCLIEEPQWFTDSLHFSGRDQETLESTSGCVLVENSEMVVTKTAEIDRIKALITRQVDKIRFPYARRPSVLPRHFVLVGSSNRLHCLPSDNTGNRRFVVISVDKKEDTSWKNGRKLRDYVINNRKQIWAEAYHIYKEGKAKILMPDDIRPIAGATAEQHRSKNEALEDVVNEFMERKKLPCSSFQMNC